MCDCDCACHQVVLLAFVIVNLFLGAITHSYLEVQIATSFPRHQSILATY